ncbi:PREDICTED: uncharacterized protein LOC104768113 [Camelina sativa]|uniref:Uncharacterized protein LOC104768113 n=1 Tax=Camelina sativa TaxID=90675 RepID=A0ABM0XSF6_CAMSA|nr:PREDICTED: uncharacterized protein LOC104768113 [Camelina sativa]
MDFPSPNSTKFSDSWNWRSLLRLRGLAREFVRCNVGNGRDLQVLENAKVREVCASDGWIITNPRSDKALNLQIYLTTIQIPHDDQGMDSYDWVVQDHICEGFSSSRTWASVRPRAALVDWFHTVWYKGAIPKHAFNMWVTNLNRLPTKVRLAHWGLNINTTCDLCSSQLESRDHLMLHCDYALVLWEAVRVRLNLPQLSFTSWSDLILWTRTKNCRSPPTLRKLVTQSVIYAIWKQRNNLHHNQAQVLPYVLFKGIDREIRNVIIARRLNKRFEKLMSCWL